MSDAALFVLSEPIPVVLSGTHGPRREEAITQVSLRPLGVRDLLLLDKHRGQPMHLIACAISTLSGLTPAQVNKINLHDYKPIAATTLRLLMDATNSFGLPPGWFIEALERAAD